MLRYHHTQAELAQAIEAWRSLFDALAGTGSWETAERNYASAKVQPWFEDSVIPPNLSLPLRGALAEGYRHFIFYDPAATLRRVKTPTLALYGADDSKVDVPHASRTLRSSFAEAGMTDFTMHVYPNAIHPLLVSSDGFSALEPERFANGYPSVMIDWLAHRGLLRPH
jgi:pimeloyl-ACP methyl ester carboxylesterase